VKAACAVVGRAAKTERAMITAIFLNIFGILG
jgi:hypothetical protein